jgi:hypothetical protein
VPREHALWKHCMIKRSLHGMSACMLPRLQFACTCTQCAFTHVMESPNGSHVMCMPSANVATRASAKATAMRVCTMLLCNLDQEDTREAAVNRGRLHSMHMPYALHHVLFFQISIIILFVAHHSSSLTCVRSNDRARRASVHQQAPSALHQLRLLVHAG